MSWRDVCHTKRLIGNTCKLMKTNCIDLHRNMSNILQYKYIPFGRLNKTKQLDIIESWILVDYIIWTWQRGGR